MARRQRNKLSRRLVEECDRHRPGARRARVARTVAKAGIDIAFGAGRRRYEAAARWRAPPLACLATVRVSRGLVRVHEHGDRRRLRHQLVQQLQPLRLQLEAKQADARDVAARPVEAGDKAIADRVGAVVKTIGIVVVAALAASAAACRRRLSRRSPPPGGATKSAASAGSRSY